MDAIIIILGVVFSYFVFVSLAVVLARMIFPKIDIDDEDLLSKEFLPLKKRDRKNQEKKFSIGTMSKERVASTYRVTLSPK